MNRTLRDASKFSLLHKQAQMSSIPCMDDFMCGQVTASNDKQDAMLRQPEHDSHASQSNAIKHTDFQELQHIMGHTTDMQEKNQLTGPSSRREQQFDYVVVIDFEATCDKNLEKLKPQEIIEFPAVLVNCRELTLDNSFQTYVRPVHHPILTDFCTHLTGIQQQQVDKGMPLSEALDCHDKWLEKNGVKEKNFAVLIWSDWDCKIMLDSECKLKGLDKPHYFNRWINLKALFQVAFNGRKCNLRKAVEISGLRWMGRAHCGLDDAMNTARLAVELMKRGVVLTVTSSLESNASVIEVRRPDWPGQPSPHVAHATAPEQPSVPSVQMSMGYTNAPARSVNGKIKVGISGTILCYCGVLCKRHTVQKLGPTHGKQFYACGNWTPSEGSRCGFFEWAGR
ncbi:hypothetical protein KP509_25G019400 [Ceratopteris richardii]|nr:hypothetical protein KP509_25G019400 [Ceratopteris richardii]